MNQEPHPTRRAFLWLSSAAILTPVAESLNLSNSETVCRARDAEAEVSKSMTLATKAMGAATTTILAGATLSAIEKIFSDPIQLPSIPPLSRREAMENFAIVAGAISFFVWNNSSEAVLCHLPDHATLKRIPTPDLECMRAHVSRQPIDTPQVQRWERLIEIELATRNDRIR